MRAHRFVSTAVVGLLASSWLTATAAAELPGHYFKLVVAEVNSLEPNNLKSNPGAMMAAAVLYAKPHAANPSFGEKSKLELALRLGDLFASQSEADSAENKQDYEWEIHFWLDTYRLLEADLSAERRCRWRREIEKIIRWFAGQVADRIDFPRYQGPYIRTSTNHLALFASEVYLAGRVLGNKEWEELGAPALAPARRRGADPRRLLGRAHRQRPGHRLQLPDDDLRRPVLRAQPRPGRPRALRRATDFHKHFTWPDGTPVETINGRNRYWSRQSLGPFRLFALARWPPLCGVPGKLLRRRQKLRAREPWAASPKAPSTITRGRLRPFRRTCRRFAYQMKVPAGIRKTGPWTVCLSGLIDTPIDSQFTLDRQGHLSIYHEKLGLIVTGANSKHQPELATFLEKTKDVATTIPLSSRLRMTTRLATGLGLGYPRSLPKRACRPESQAVGLRFAITETGNGRLGYVQPQPPTVPAGGRNAGDGQVKARARREAASSWDRTRSAAGFAIAAGLCTSIPPPG